MILRQGRFWLEAKTRAIKEKKKIFELLFEIHHLKNKKTSHGLEKHIFKTQN